MSVRRHSFALLTLIGLLLVSTICLANSITISPPVMLDTSAVYQASGALGSFIQPTNLHSALGDSSIFYCMTARDSSQSLVFVRTDLDGHVLDTIPRLLQTALAYASGYTLAPTEVRWVAPYFVVYGSVTSGSSSTKQPGYVRVTRQGEIVDAIPHVFVSGTPGINLTVPGSAVWEKYQSGNGSALTWVISLYDLSSGTRLLNNVAVSLPSNWSYTQLGTEEGLYLAVCALDGTTILNRLIAVDGSVTVLDSISNSSPIPYRTHFNGLQFDSDTALFFAVDSGWKGSPQIYYYFVTKVDSAGATSLQSVPIPQSEIRDCCREVRGTIQADTLILIETDAYTGLSRMLRVDVRQGVLLDVTPIRGQVAGSQVLESFSRLGSTGYLSGRHSSDIVQLRFQISSPQTSLDSTSVFRTADHRRFPSVVCDSAGALVYDQYIARGEMHLEFYRIRDVNHPLNFEHSTLMSGRKPYRPELQTLGTRKVLFWKEDATPSLPANRLDTVFARCLAVLDADFPTDEQVSSAPQFGSVDQNYQLRPTCVQVDTTMYFNYLSGYGTYDNWEWRTIFQLSSVNLQTSSMNSRSLGAYCGGWTALLPHGNSVEWIVSGYRCLSHTNVHCLLHQGIWTFYCTDGQSTFCDSSTNMPYYDVFSGDAVAVPWGDRFLVALEAISKELHTYTQLYTYEPTSGAFTPITIPDGPFPGGELHMVPLDGGICIFTYSGVPLQLTLWVFDLRWNLTEKTSIPLEGIPIEFSEFARIPGSTEIAFAYSSFITEKYASARVFFQTVKVDVTTAVDDQAGNNPAEFRLSQNYPNPFNASTVIEFSLAARSRASIEIYNILGQRVWSHQSEELAAGFHRVMWDGESDAGKKLSSGVYFCRLSSGHDTATRKLLLLK
jgi:hypothetical protein